MNKNLILKLSPNKRFLGILSVIAILLLIPLTAMQFTNQVKWSVFDFIVAGLLLLFTGLVLEFILRRLTATKHRIIAAIILFILLFIVWAELAVGIFGSPFAGN